MDESLSSMNETLRTIIAKRHGAKIGKSALTHDEKKLIASSDFQHALEEARQQIEEEKTDNIFRTDENGCNIYFSKVNELAVEILNKFSLPDVGWLRYVEDAILYEDSDEYSIIGTDRIKIESIDNTYGHITIRLAHGLNRQDYIAAWGAIAEFLDKPPSYTDKAGSDLNKQMYQLHFFHNISYGQIAKQYFPHEQGTAESRKLSTDKVKKRIKSYAKQIKSREKKSQKSSLDKT